ncbi:protein AF-9-like isoform X4 [Oncorhynchus keta]|nr:protein AF-9-like isoform X4 [Oncorhynchus keta]
MSHCSSQEEPKKVRFDYDLFLHLDGHPPVNHLRCEKLTFNNPTEEFRRKLLKAGGQRDPSKRSLEDSKVMVMQEGSTSLFGQHLKLPTLPSSSLTLTLSDAKKSKVFPGSKDSSKGTGALLTTTTTTTTTTTNSSSSSKLLKPSKDHKDKPSKETKSAFRDCGREPSKASKDFSKKPKENQPLLRDNPPIPKMGFKEPKTMSKEHRQDGGYLHGAGSGAGTNKRLSVTDCEDHVTKKKKKNLAELSLKPTGGSSLSHAQSHHSDKKLLKDKSQVHPAKLRVDGREVLGERRKAFPELMDANYSDMEDNMSTKAVSEQPSPASSSSSSSPGFAASHKRQVAEFVRRKVGAVPGTAHTVLGPLRSIIHDLQSEDNEDDSEDDDDMDSDLERPVHTHMTHRHRRVSLSDGSESENSSAPSPHSRHEPPPLLKTSNNQILEVKQTKQDKNKNIDCDKAYLDELVELHRRLMTLRERHILQQIVNLIEETGHFHITNTTFDFDLCSLDKITVRKLQSYLETSGTS